MKSCLSCTISQPYHYSHTFFQRHRSSKAVEKGRCFLWVCLDDNLHGFVFERWASKAVSISPKAKVISIFCRQSGEEGGEMHLALHHAPLQGSFQSSAISRSVPQRPFWSANARQFLQFVIGDGIATSETYLRLQLHILHWRSKHVARCSKFWI